MAHGSKRERKEEAVIAALLSEATIGGAAARVGISKRALTNWLARPDFKAKFEAARRQLLDMHLSRMVGMVELSLDTLAQAQGEEQKMGDRIKAAAVHLRTLDKRMPPEPMAPAAYSWAAAAIATLQEAMRNLAGREDLARATDALLDPNASEANHTPVSIPFSPELAPWRVVPPEPETEVKPEPVNPVVQPIPEPPPPPPPPPPVAPAPPKQPVPTPAAPPASPQADVTLWNQIMGGSAPQRIPSHHDRIFGS